jgi:hypothetical protein
MTNEQKQHATISIEVVQEQLQAIVSGQHERAQMLEKRRQYVDWQVCYLLAHLIPTLPRSIRAQVQACYDLREQAWSEEYAQAYYDAQKEASPTGLTAQDSL